MFGLGRRRKYCRKKVENSECDATYQFVFLQFYFPKWDVGLDNGINLVVTDSLVMEKNVGPNVRVGAIGKTRK